jgi:hypothetical protein
VKNADVGGMATRAAAGVVHLDGESGVLQTQLTVSGLASGLELCVLIHRLDDPDLRDIE